MGMSSSDDEAKIMEDHALLEWAKKTPKPSWDYDRIPTEEEKIAHEEAIKQHYKKRPQKSSPWNRDKR